jgi:hypothetical protein
MSSGPLAIGGEAFGFQISPNSARVLFFADKVTDGVFELFRVQIGGVALALDIDGDDKVLPASDLLLLARHQFGLRGNGLIDNATSTGATITSAAAIEARLAAALAARPPGFESTPVLDVDADLLVLPTTDVLLLLRYQLGLRGDALIANVLGAAAPSRDPVVIESRIRTALEFGLPF